MEFSELYEKYIEKIYSYIFYRVQHRETAEDLTSLTFTKALENFKKFSPSKGTFSAWLYRIAKNCIYDHYRSNHPNQNIEDAFDLHSEEDISAETDNKIQMEKIQKILSTLKSDQRDLVIMRLWDGLSYREIADITGKNENSLKVTFSRTLAKIRSEEIILLVFAPSIIDIIK